MEDERLQEISAKASAFAKDTMETADAFLKDERVQEISAKAGKFAKDALSQVFEKVGGAIGGKLKELKEQKKEASTIDE